MKTSQKHLIKAIAFSFFYLIIFISWSNSIEIIEETKSLVAPEGSEYLWLHNDVVQMGENDRTFHPEESGKYTVEFTDESGERNTATVTVAVTAQSIRKVFIISDSIAANYGTRFYPQMGWGQILQVFFNESQINVENRARGGRSSRSYYEEGLWGPSSGVSSPSGWTYVVEELSEGDFVFIQFGANDRNVSHPTRGATPDVYKGFLKTYVDETKAKNAIPVLISPLMLNGTRNVYTESGSDYRGAMLEVAEEEDVMFIDVNMMSLELNKELGSEYTGKYLYLGLDPDEYENWPDGVNDFTHIQEMGAMEVCKMIIRGLKEQTENQDATDLVNALKPTYEVNITSDSNSPGLMTLSGEYPAGAAVTMKVRPKRGFTFLRWEDGNGLILDENVLTTLTVEESNQSIKAVFSDCNGDLGGDGYLDNCNSCVDGVTVKQACSNGVAGNKACLWEGETYSDTINDIETNFASVGSPDGDTITYVVRTTADDNYELGIKYLNGEADLKAQVFVNGELQISSFEIPEASSNAFGYAFFNVDLISSTFFGNNNISLVFPPMNEKLDIAFFATYSSQVFQGNSCQPTVFVSPLSNQLKASDLKVYPNPFSSTLKISGLESGPYKIISLTGAVMEAGFCGTECEIGKGLATGTYILKAFTGTETKTVLVIKK